MNIQNDALSFLKDVNVRLSVELGSTTMPLRELMDLKEDKIVVLDRLTDELVDVSVNGKRIARGEVVTEGNRFGLRIVEMEGHAPVDALSRAPELPSAAEIVTEA